MNTLAARSRWLVLAVLSVAVLLITLDMTVLYTALPRLTADLGASAAGKLWIINVYPLVVAGLLPGLGTLGDRVGHKSLFLAGLLVFGAASLVAAFAPAPGVLIGARVLLACRAAAMMPATLSLIRLTFEDQRERAFAIGLWSSVASGGAALGPVLGGLLLERFWWGSVFLINVPIVAVALPLAAMLIPRQTAVMKHPWDFLGSLQILAGLVACTYAVKELARRDGSWVMAAIALAVGVVMLMLFKARQSRLAHKLIDFSLFRNWRFASGVTAAVVAAFALVGFELVLVQRLQLVEGLSPLRAGLVLLPIPLSAFVTGPVAGALSPRLGAMNLLWAGLLAASLGLAASALTYDFPLSWQIPGFVILGIGIGTSMAAASDTILSSAPADRAGMAASIEEVSFELGGAAGIAVLGSLMTAVYGRSLLVPGSLTIPGVAFDSLDEAFAVAGTLPTETALVLRNAARVAFDQAVVAVMMTAVVVLFAVASGIAFRVYRRRDNAPTAAAASSGMDRSVPQQNAALLGNTLAGPPPVRAARILALFRPYAGRIALVLALILAASATGLAAPFLLRAIVDVALPRGDLGLLTRLAAGLIGIAVLSTGIGVLQVLLTSRVGQAIMHDLRVRVYAHLQSLSLGFYTATRTGEIQSRIASDIGGLQALVTHTAGELTRNTTTVTMTALAMLVLDWRLAVLSFLVVPLATWLSRKVGDKREALTHEQQERIADMSSAVQESLSISGIILARTMGRTQLLVQRFARASADVAALEVRAHTAGQWEWSLVELTLQVLPALTLLLGGWLVHAGTAVTIGTIVAMIALQEQLLWPLAEVLRAGVEIRSTRALFARIFDYLDKPVEIAERADPVVRQTAMIRGEVRLVDVHFAYDPEGPPTIDGVSLDIPAGSHLAIVGATGSGKTTLGYLLARLYDVDEGAILFDGVDVRDLSFRSLTDTLGVVTQDPYLLHATVAENLRFAKPGCSDADIVAAARVAQLHGMLSALPQGYDTMVGERGYRFSGGEKQRLSLARTLLRDPRVLLLDEATSALDTATERALSDALDHLSHGRTTITIAHRLSTVRQADRIVVLDRGRIVEAGRHDELLARRGSYAGLVASAA